MSLNSYELLGIAPGAGKEDVKKAFKRLAMAFHPDLNPEGQAHFGKICRAYQQLMNGFEKEGLAELAANDEATAAVSASTGTAVSLSRERRTSRRLPQHRRFELVQENHYKGTSVSEKV